MVKMIASRDLASAAGNIGFHRDPLAGLQVVPLGGFASNLNNLACYLMPHDQGVARNRYVSLKNLDIAGADRSDHSLYQDMIRRRFQ